MITYSRLPNSLENGHLWKVAQKSLNFNVRAGEFGKNRCREKGSKQAVAHWCEVIEVLQFIDLVQSSAQFLSIKRIGRTFCTIDTVRES